MKRRGFLKALGVSPAVPLIAKAVEPEKSKDKGAVCDELSPDFYGGVQVGCSDCSQIFANPGAYNWHNKTGKCVDPEKCGLHKDFAGYWDLPKNVYSLCELRKNKRYSREFLREYHGGDA